MAKIRKSLCIILSLIIALSSITAFAKDNITVKLDGTEIAFDVPPQIINGRTMVPMRAIFESLGATVNWEESTKIVTSVKGTTTISLAIDTPSIIVNGNTNPLDAPPCIIDGRTLVPVRAISEAFNLNVEWDEANKVVNIESKSNIYNNSESPFARLAQELISKGEYHDESYSIINHQATSSIGITYHPDSESIGIGYVDDDDRTIYISFSDNSDGFYLSISGFAIPDNYIFDIPKAYVTSSDNWASNISYLIGTSDSTVIKLYSKIVHVALLGTMVALMENGIDISMQDLGFVNY